MKPYYDHGGIKIYHGDCREFTPQNFPISTVVTDPPYGIKWRTNTDRFPKGGTVTNNELIYGDETPVSLEKWLDFPKVCIWGFQMFCDQLQPGRVLIWLKVHEDNFCRSLISDAEVAWVKGGHGVRAYKDVSGYGKRKERAHPTQKPLGVMLWSIEQVDFYGESPILDPFMGSGTTLVAAKQLGRKAIGIEIEERYCEIAAKRLSQEVLPFDQPAIPQPVQLEIG